MNRARIILILSLFLLLAGCNLPEKTAYQSYFTNRADQNTDITESTETPIIEIWTPEDIVSSTLRYFSHQYDEFEFEVTIVDQVDLVDTYYEALLTNTEPDLMIISARDIGAFSGLDMFETLNQEPYYNHQFFKERPDSILEMYLNDEGQMYGFPIHFFPMVTLYRADIFEEYGFPTDPERLGDYINDPENWLKIITTLQEDGLSGYESTQTILEWGLNAVYPFDGNYQYTYQNEPFSALIDVLIELDQLDYDIDRSIWREPGYQALKNDQLVMFQGASYLNDVVYDWFPEQAGKWRITNLPFGMNGIDKGTNLVATIPKNASNKNVVWNLVRALSDDLLNMHAMSHSHPLYDQDNLSDFYLSLLGEPSIGKPSMLDKTAELLWENNVYRVNQGYRLNDSFFQQTHNQVIEQVRNNRRVLIDN